MFLNGPYCIKDYRCLFEGKGITCLQYPSLIFHNNYQEVYNNPFFSKLANAGYIFGIDKGGDIIYYFKNKIKHVPFRNLDFLLSKISEVDVKAFKTISELSKWRTKQQNTSLLLVALTDLPIIFGTTFVASNNKFIQYYHKEFYLNLFCIGNHLTNSNYFYGLESNAFYCTLQYLYHISGYETNKFNYIMCWLSNMIKFINNDVIDSSLFNSILVLRGGEKSGKEIFFNQIIQPLFGNEYCLRLDSKTLSQKNLEKEISNKIFYNLDNISSDSMRDRKKKELVHNILTKQDKNILGTVITTDIKYIPYDLSGIEYVVLDLPDDVATMYIPHEFKNQFNLKDSLTYDLCNFSRILKSYTSNTIISYIKDVDITKKLILEDCIIEFASELTSSQSLLNHIDKVKWNKTDETFENIKELYNKHKKIERKYIYELFKQKYDYDISATTLYKNLKQLDENLFKTVLAPGGAKCFYFPDKN